FLAHEVGVRAAHAGGHHAGSSGSVAGPVPQARVHVEWRAGKIDFGIGLREVETGRKLSVLEGKDRLDDTGDGRRGVEVSHIGLYRTDGEVAGAMGKGAERIGQGSDIDGIRDWSSRVEDLVARGGSGV